MRGSFQRVVVWFLLAIIGLNLVASPSLGLVEGSADAPLPPPQADGYQVELEKLDFQKITGQFLLPQILLEVEYGDLQLDPRRVKRVDLAGADEPGGHPSCNLMLVDKQQLHGHWKSSHIELRTPQGETLKLPVAEVSSLKFLHPKDPSLIAALVGLLTLTFLEIVLGIDNVIFLAILAGKLPEEQRPRARRLGLIFALVTRLLLLFTLSYLMGLTRPLFVLPQIPLLATMESRGISARDLILLLGGLFLVGKSTYEMHEKVEAARGRGSHAEASSFGSSKASFAYVLVMIALVDIVFSLDSVITAVGIVDELWIMVVAMLLAMGVMLIFAEPISRFVDKHPTMKILALSFLILIGVLLLAEGLGQHVNKGYVYFAMLFSVVVEIVNMQLRGSKPPSDHATAH